MFLSKPSAYITHNAAQPLTVWSKVHYLWFQAQMRSCCREIHCWGVFIVKLIHWKYIFHTSSLNTKCRVQLFGWLIQVHLQNKNPRDFDMKVIKRRKTKQVQLHTLSFICVFSFNPDILRRACTNIRGISVADQLNLHCCLCTFIPMCSEGASVSD